MKSLNRRSTPTLQRSDSLHPDEASEKPDKQLKSLKEDDDMKLASKEAAADKKLTELFQNINSEAQAQAWR